MTTNPRIPVRTWLTGRCQSAGSESALRGWRLRMSLVYRRRLMPVRPETVVVRVPGPLAPGSPAHAHIGHTHHHAYLSFHQHVRQMFRQYRGPESSSAAGRTSAGSIEPSRQPHPGVMPVDRFLRPTRTADREAPIAPRRRSTDRVEHQNPPQLPSRLMYRSATASSVTSESGDAAASTRIAHGLRSLRVSTSQPESVEQGDEPQRAAPLVHQLQRRTPDVTETRVEGPVAGGFTSHKSSPIVWRQVPKASGDESDPPTTAAGHMRARAGITGRQDAPASTPVPLPVSAPAAPSRAPVFEGAALDRLADDVMQRIDRRIRIERERRGL